MVTIPEIVAQPTPAAWNVAPSPPGPLDAWTTSATPVVEASLGVGEGWADTITATRSEAEPSYSSIQEVQAHLPPNDIATAGPIATSTPPTAPIVESVPEVQTSAGPPGLSKRVSATITRPQQEAVVMPSTLDRTPTAVQFGSLSLFDGQQGFAADTSAPQEAAPQQK